MRAKLKLHNIITITPMVICSVILGIEFKLSILQIILVTVVPVIFVMLNGALGLIINLKMPNLNWVTEAAAVKQSFGVFLAILLAWGNDCSNGSGVFESMCRLDRCGYIFRHSSISASMLTTYCILSG